MDDLENLLFSVEDQIFGLETEVDDAALVHEEDCGHELAEVGGDPVALGPGEGTSHALKGRRITSPRDSAP